MIEFAAMMSAYSPGLIASPAPLPRDALQDYWSCSRARFRHWHGWLEAFPDTIFALPPDQRVLHWDRTEGLLSEIFLTELVTRVCGAVLCARDQVQGGAEASTFARNVFTGHLEARQWALRLMLDGPFATIDQIARVDRLRRRVERWTDLLLGHLVTRHDVADFAFDLERSLDFGEEQIRESQGAGKYRIWQLYAICLRTAFPEQTDVDPMQQQLRQEVLQALLGCFPPDLFDPAGPLKGVWRLRLEQGRDTREGPPPRGSVDPLPRRNSPDNHTVGRPADSTPARRPDDGERLLDQIAALHSRVRPTHPNPGSEPDRDM